MSVTEVHRQIRWRNIARGGASSFVARMVALACVFAQVPIALQFLGAEGFGIWVIWQSVAAFVVMLDLGTGFNLQNAAARANARGRMAEIGGIIRSALWTSLLMAGGLVLIAFSLNTFNWAKALLPKSEGLLTALTPQLGVLTVLVSLGIPAMIGPRLAAGVQQTWLVGISQAVTSFLTLLMVVFCSTRQTSLGVFLVCTLAVPLVVNSGLLLGLLWNLKLVRAFLQPVSLSEWFAGLRGGLPFLVPQLSANLRQAIPPFIIAAMLGAAAVTPYNLIFRLMNLIGQPLMWLLEPLWVAYADASSRNDFPWIQRALKISLGVSLLGTVLPMVLSYWWGPPFLEWWTGHPARVFSQPLFFWMIGWHATTALIQPISYCLNGLSRLGGQVLYGSASTLVGLGLMAPACRHGGLDLVCMPMALAMVFINLPGAILDIRRVMLSWIIGGNPKQSELP